VTGLSIAVVGGGIFGVTAARALVARGHRVTLLDPGPIPHPLAESTDISKVVRMDYGADEAYLALMEQALDRWRAWNGGWPSPLFHETGVTFLCRAPMTPGGFEHDSYRALLARGHRPERVDADALRRRFPAWNADVFVDGYFNPEGGFAESGKVVAALTRQAEAEGVELIGGARFEQLLVAGSRVSGIAAGGVERVFDRVVIAAGAWTPYLLPELAGCLRTVGQPVFHLRPADPSPFVAERFPVFGADISRTGYYGFPVNRDGVLKIANHGVGRPMHPESPAREVSDAETVALRAFLETTFPALVDAPIAYTRVCVYCDTADEHFWIAADPQREGLVVAGGGSGHAFKFAPLLGDLTADAVEGVPNPALTKFRWRIGASVAAGEEAARHHG
jgi:glycine/D-amino acid oxidase-like deaminating enzyme